MHSLLAAYCIVKPKNNTLQSWWLGSSDRADMHLHLKLLLVSHVLIYNLGITPPVAATAYSFSMNAPTDSVLTIPEITRLQRGES